MSERSKRMLFQFSFVLIALVIIEIVLRTKGYKPGDMKPNWLNFHPVDSLYVINEFYTNPEGLLLADSTTFAAQATYVNSDGFRSPDLAKIDTTKKKILFIGDSFTWGMSAKPIQDNCFADLLRNETNYEVVNLGIPAADPVQYAMLAEKYIPKIKPDYVLVMFFTGNDLMKEDRKVIPGSPYYYWSNAGALLADMDGKHFNSAQQAYNYIVNDKYYLRRSSNLFEKVIARSSLLSRLYSVRFRIKEKLEYENMLNDTRITKRYLNKIKAVAKQNHVPVKFVLIPEVKEADMPIEKYRQRYASLLDDSLLKSDWLLVQNSKTNFVDYPDAHLNNKGHRFYADFLEAFLKNAPELK
jgi:lysophospholipase L1-like esterase